MDTGRHYDGNVIGLRISCHFYSLDGSVALSGTVQKSWITLGPIQAVRQFHSKCAAQFLNLMTLLGEGGEKFVCEFGYISCVVGTINTAAGVDKICLIGIDIVGDFAAGKCPSFKPMYQDK